VHDELFEHTVSVLAMRSLPFVSGTFLSFKFLDSPLKGPRIFTPAF